jgi:polar amino acid transport system substrate-binding protein
MKKFYLFFALLLVLALVTACGNGEANEVNNGNAGDVDDTGTGNADTGEDEGPAALLDVIKERGYLVVSTDPNYEPQSFLDPDAERAEGTICPSDLLTYGEMVGFDVDVAKAVADGLGVEVCFATPDWDVVTAGNWGDRWDLSVGSMTVTTDRQVVLDFVTPYYYTPAQFAASADSGITSWEDLDGQVICVAASTTYLDWLNGVDLGLPAESFYTDPPVDFTIVELPTDQECAQSIAAGRPEFSVYLTSGTVVDSNIANGLAVVKVGTAVFSENLAPAIDKNSSYDTATFIAAVDEIINILHSDGTLSDLSLKWFEVDLTTDPTL